MTSFYRRVYSSRRRIMIGLAIAVAVVGIAGTQNVKPAGASAAGGRVDLRVRVQQPQGGTQLVGVCNYGNATSRSFITEFWFNGTHGQDTVNGLAPQQCAAWRITIHCPETITIWADRAGRTTSYNYGANRLDEQVRC